MPEKWTGELIAKMHLCGVSRKALAESLGWSKEYVSMILKGNRNPKNAQEKLENAFAQLQKK